MQSHIMLERLDGEQEPVERGYLAALDETCRILQGLKLCSRHCAACQIACNIAEIALPLDRKAETWDASPVVVRRR